MTGSNHQISHYPLSTNVQIVLTNQPELELPLNLEEEVEAIWLREKAKKNLYNSLLFSLSSFSENRLHGRFVEYRYFIATRHNRELQDDLQIYPLGISGLTICRDHILIGRRDLKLATYGGYLECVPSGSIEARAYMQGEVDFLAQVMWELQEEARYPEKNVKEVHTLGLYFSPQDGIYDIGVHLELALEEHEMLPDGTTEYPLLEWMPLTSWQMLIENADEKIVPLSKALWHTYSKQLPK